MKGAPASRWKRRGFSSRWRKPFLFLLALVAAGCQQLQFERVHDDAYATAPGSETPRRRRELAMNGQWQNRRFSELVAALGEPLMLLNIPGGGNPPGFAAVYGRDPLTGCLDAFALVYGRDPTIRLYHCR